MYKKLHKHTIYLRENGMIDEYINDFYFQQSRAHNQIIDDSFKARIIACAVESFDNRIVCVIKCFLYVRSFKQNSVKNCTVSKKYNKVKKLRTEYKFIVLFLYKPLMLIAVFINTLCCTEQYSFRGNLGHSLPYWPKCRLKMSLYMSTS